MEVQVAGAQFFDGFGHNCGFLVQSLFTEN
jgi:hypothetical protein